ncbi:immunoglobulin-like domain-containing protein [Listeria rocourtiae]|uniref:immunoglobulin-like domain-containing protein n=1 Tax=Listeria rocourtiae TaxID=647910 RepID=UPI003D2F8F10
MRNEKRFKETWRKVSIAFLIGGTIASSLTTTWDAQIVSATTDTQQQTLQESPAVIALENGDFEQPQFSTTSKIFNQSSVPGWMTTASDGKIELQRSIDGVTAFSGSQYAELNAYEVAALYQDIPTTPGVNVRWQAYHSGRRGVDTASVAFGAPGETMVQQAEMVDDNTGWGLYKGVYTIPEGQTTTRFQFQSVSSAGDNPAVGNLLDNIQFATQSILQVDGTFSATNMKVRNTQNYQLQVKNIGGMPTANSTITIKVPPELDYTPGTLSSSDTSITNEQYNASIGELSFNISTLKKDVSASIQIPLTAANTTSMTPPITSATYNDENFNEEVYTANATDSSVTILDNQLPVITGESESIIQPDSTFDVMSTIQATDAEDGDITSDVKVTGEVDTSTSGLYELTYDVTDSDGNTSTFKRSIIVRETSHQRYYKRNHSKR